MIFRYLLNTSILIKYVVVIFPLKVKSWSSLVEGGEGSYLPKWKAFVFMYLQNNRKSIQREITKFV